MSLNKAIYYRKEYRKPYYRSQSFDYTCRPHRSCGYCRANRLFPNYRRMVIADETLDGFDFPIKGRKINFRI